MGFAKPELTARLAAEAGERKAGLPVVRQLVLGFAAGAYVAFGFLLAIRVSASMPPEWGGIASVAGAAVFPLGLILTLAAGGELLTGNMMAVSFAVYTRKIRLRAWASNMLRIAAANMAGAVFVAYAFGHLVGLTETGPYMDKLVALTDAKLEEPFLTAFLSGAGCNWLVSLAVWLYYGAQDGAGKMIGVWFPTMAFVAIGFQHIVANMFLIPAAIFAGAATWGEFAANFVPVFLGNAVGGALFVAGLYAAAYPRSGTD